MEWDGKERGVGKSIGGGAEGGVFRVRGIVLADHASDDKACVMYFWKNCLLRKKFLYRRFNLHIALEVLDPEIITNMLISFYDHHWQPRPYSTVQLMS